MRQSLRQTNVLSNHHLAGSTCRETPSSYRCQSQWPDTNEEEEKRQAVLTNHAMHDGMVGRDGEGRAQLYPQRGDAQGAARASHCRARARLESYLRQ